MTIIFRNDSPFEPAEVQAPSNSTAAPKPDCETAVLLRASLNPVFDRATSWAALMDVLNRKGYGLAFRYGRLCLTSLTTKRRVCSDRFLGQPFADLVARFGRPAVRALPGGRGDGELIT